MIDKVNLCAKIRDIYPDIGSCGIELKVEFDHQQQRWVVDLEKDGRRLKTYLEPTDAERCMLGEQCVGLGLEIAQLRDNIEQL